MYDIINKTIFITGCCGTVGKEILNQIQSNEKYVSTNVIGVDNDESGIFLLSEQYRKNINFNFYVADITNKQLMIKLTRDANCIIHAAASKHVILSESTPEHTIQTNISGLQNIIEAAERNVIEKVIFTSSDKAVNPTNVMGATKLLGEKIITAASKVTHPSSNRTIFASTRFGNVLGSNGSVIDVFKNQISRGGPVTVTHKEMTRFVMSIADSATLVLGALEDTIGGEVLVTKMKVLRIIDLANVMIQTLAPKHGFTRDEISIEIIGSKPGEKLYEELMSDEETRRAIELEDYFSVMPPFGDKDFVERYQKEIVNHSVTDPYISSKQKYLTQEEIKKVLIEYGLI